MNPNWSRVQAHLEQKLLPIYLPKECASQETARFIQHVSEHLTGALQSGAQPKVVKALRAQLGALRAIHGIQIKQENWEEFVNKLVLILEVGAVVLL